MLTALFPGGSFAVLIIIFGGPVGALQTSLGHSMRPALPGLYRPRGNMGRHSGFQLRHSDIPKNVMATATRLVPAKGKLIYRALVDGVGMLLIEFPPSYSYSEFADWAGAHRFGFPMLGQFLPINPKDLDDPDFLPQYGVGAWGWILLNRDSWGEGQTRQAVIGFPVDYQSPAVIRYQQKPKW